jgi:hypothetical protein
MAQKVSVIVSADDRARLEAIVGNRNQRRKHVQRAQIVKKPKADEKKVLASAGSVPSAPAKQSPARRERRRRNITTISKAADF